MIRPVALAEAHMECRELRRTVPVLTDILAFEKVRESDGMATLKHPNTPWLLVVHEGGPDIADKPAAHHMGVRVEHVTEIDAAWEYLQERQDDYGLYGMKEPQYGHGSYSLHFREPGGNDWEIECYETVLRKEQGGQRLGGVRSHHWETALESERFASHGYVPQAFTHGTLHTDDVAVCSPFLTGVLGLDAHQAYAKVIYTKHPETKHFVVCLQGGERNQDGENFRFTLTVDSPAAVHEAHDWLESAGSGLGVTALGDVRDDAFLLRDPDNNCWEIAAR
jgi:catechol-2,3-dioxygenase